MKLELADGKFLDVSDIGLIHSEIDKLDKKNDHLILSDDDNFIQIAFSGHDLYETEYSDESGYYQAKDQDQGLALIKKIFEGFYNKTSGWKNLTPWELIEDNETSSSSSNYSSTSRSSGNFKEDLVDGLKRDAVNWGKRKLKRFLKF
ncbi:MAG: hypothetical protein U9N32_03125 [Spirochaetota bacterium]|nr:hypothetical protein [Spirochaetota bacterium]